MRGIVINFLRMEVLNMHPAVYLGMFGVWVLLLISAFMSVRSLPIKAWAKALWILVIIALPVVGLFLYVLRCLFKSNWEAFEFLFHSRRIDAKVAPASKTNKAA